MGNAVCKALCNRQGEREDALDGVEQKARNAAPSIRDFDVNKITSKAKVNVRAPPPSPDMSVLDDKLKAALVSLPTVGATVNMEKANKVYAASQLVAAAVASAPTAKKAATWAASERIWSVAESLKISSHVVQVTPNRHSYLAGDTDQQMSNEEDVLIVPPKLVKDVREFLAVTHCLPMRWHEAARYGVQIGIAGEGSTGNHRLIPLVPGAATRLANVQQVEYGKADCPGAAAFARLAELLRDGQVKVGRAQPVQPKHIDPYPADMDHTVHPERAVETVAAPPLESGQFTFVELFAGVGGFRLGLEAIGGTCVFASEIQPDAVDTYLRNFGASSEVTGDITQVTNDQIPQHDLLVGGFPCQPFSSLGLQPGLADDKGNLFKEIVRILESRQPKAFLLENVPGLLNAEDGDSFETILRALSEAGYEVHHELVNARCLTAQSRNRLYFIGFRNDIAKGQNDSFVFPFIPDLRLRGDDVFEQEHHIEASGLLDNFTLTDEQMMRLRQSHMWTHRGGLKTTLAWGDKILQTLTSHYSVTISKGTSQLVPRSAPNNLRRFTPRECARLMGFSNSFALPQLAADQNVNSWFKSQYRLLGNAVCPPVIAALGGAILERCHTHCRSSNEHDWVSVGRAAAMRLALQAIVPHRLKERLVDLHESWQDEFT